LGRYRDNDEKDYIVYEKQDAVENYRDSLEVTSDKPCVVRPEPASNFDLTGCALSNDGVWKDGDTPPKRVKNYSQKITNPKPARHAKGENDPITAVLRQLYPEIYKPASDPTTNAYRTEARETLEKTERARLDAATAPLHAAVGGTTAAMAAAAAVQQPPKISGPSGRQPAAAPSRVWVVCLYDTERVYPSHEDAKRDIREMLAKSPHSARIDEVPIFDNRRAILTLTAVGRSHWNISGLTPNPRMASTKTIRYHNALPGNDTRRFSVHYHQRPKPFGTPTR
jgi:hypothetical protein